MSALARRRALLGAAAGAPMWLSSTACSLAPPSRPTRTYQVIDLMPAFWPFWTQARGLEPARQSALLLDTLFARHPEVYNARVLGLDPDRPLADEVARRYGRWLQRFEPRVEGMRRVAQRIAAELSRYDATFRGAFPDMDYDGEVYFLNSLGAFDGAGRTVKGRTALLFGVDMIAFIYGDEIDPQPFFHHELFHIYHQRVMPPGGERLIDGLWAEGLALHVAKTLNPGAGGVALFGLPPDMPQRAQQQLPRIARELRERLDSTDPDAYARFFLGSGAAHGDLPPRSGYYAGYRVAQRIGTGRSLSELARLHGPAWHGAVEGALRELEVAP